MARWLLYKVPTRNSWTHTCIHTPMEQPLGAISSAQGHFAIQTGLGHQPSDWKMTCLPTCLTPWPPELQLPLKASARCRLKPEDGCLTPGTRILPLSLQGVCAADLLHLTRCCCSHMQRLLHAVLLSFYIEFSFKIPLNMKVFDVFIYEAFNSYLV